MESLKDAMDRVQKEYEAEGFTLYSRSPREKFSVLIMFKEATSVGERFSVLIFDNEQPSKPDLVSCFVDAAKAKVEAFGTAHKILTNCGTARKILTN